MPDSYKVRIALLSAVAALAACQSAETRRLEPILRIGEERGELSAEIGAETRYLLSEIRNVPILFNQRYRVAADGRVEIRRELPPRLAAAGRVVVVVKASADSRSWRELPPFVAPVRSAGRGGSVDLAFQLPAELRGAEVTLHGRAWAPHAEARTRDAGEAFEVPVGAVLEVGGGLLAAARGQGDVRFRVEACRASACAEILAETVRRDAARWTDWRLPLDDFAGDEITLVFSTELSDAVPGAYSLAVWSRPTVYAPARTARRRPNVILLSIDTLRADHLTSYGHERDTAPKLRRWFEESGVLFENPVAAATTTGPSHMTMFTSLAPTVHGLTDRPGVRPPPPLTLAEVLRANGYATGAVTEDGPLHAGWGFSRGFDSYAENRSSDVMLPEGHVAATFAAAETWLRRNADKSFFLFLHTFEVHYPYTPPARYAALFGNPERHPGLPPEYAPVLYDREIRHVDDQLDSFLGKLREAGILDDTIFIVTSDHGEEFLEHGHIGHAGNLHPEVLRVPLLIRGPGIAGGRRIAAPVAHTDYMPTILGLLGIDSPAAMMGRDLAAVVRGDSDEIAPAPLYSEAWYATAMLAGGRTVELDTPSIAVRRGDRKLIRNQRPGGGFDYRYYDLATDPDERDDLYAEKPRAAADLQELAAGYEPRMAALRRRANQARAAFSKAPRPRREEAEVDPAVLEKLRALGYVE